MWRPEPLDALFEVGEISKRATLTFDEDRLPERRSAPGQQLQLLPAHTERVDSVVPLDELLLVEVNDGTDRRPQRCVR